MNRWMKWMLAGAVTLSTSPAFAARADVRAAKQEARIEKGVQTGQLTPKEAARLERREARLQSKIAQDRAANGGTLTAKQQMRVEHQQNRLSREIYRKKNNARHR